MYWNQGRTGELQPITVVSGGCTQNVNFQMPGGGAIRGTVTETDDITPIPNASVNLYDENGQWVDGTGTDGVGDYAFYGVPDGCYLAEAWGPWGSYYAQATYAGLEGTLWTRDNFNQATRIEVQTGQTESDIDFALTIGGRILGTVRDEPGSPVGGVTARAYDEDGWHIFGAGTDPNPGPGQGTYQMTLAPGTYYLDVQTDGNPDLCFLSAVSYDDKAGSFNWYFSTGRLSELQPIQVQPNLDVSPVDLVMPAAGAVTGRVTEEDGSTGIAGADVGLYDDDGWRVGGAWTEDDGAGTYTICSVPPGTYRADTWGPGDSYFTQETYDGLPGTLWMGDNYQNATPIGVMENDTAADINFTLGLGGKIRGTLTRADGGQAGGHVGVTAYDETG